MSVDFSVCRDCDDTFCECGHHSTCEDCGAKLCSECGSDRGILGSMSKNGFIEWGDGEDEREECGVCPWCSGEEVTTEELLHLALEKLKITEEALTIELKKRIQNE